MKLSQETITILKNFCAINANILINPGNSIVTISEGKNILASATVNENFTSSFGIYDLNEFLSALSLVDVPELELFENFVHIRSGKTVIKYFFADKSLLTLPQKNSIKLPSIDLKFILSDENMQRIKKAASVFGHLAFEVIAENGVVDISVSNPKNTVGNTYTLTVDENNESKISHQYPISIGNLKMLPGSYEVSLCSRVAHFKNTNIPVEYWIALDSPKK